ncbi:NapC/NirT family cytochrome c [Myxococcota bacterium]|nr:NapC/NirT family cytochrome c [Myxococcota bacterium]
MSGRQGRELWRNTLSYFGGLITLFGVLLMLGSIVVHFSLRQPSPYLGIFTWMVFPTVAVSGIVLVLWGMRRESLRRRRAGTTESLPFPRLDLNDPRQRKVFALSLVGGALLAVAFAMAGYNAFLFTESPTFCGEICHTVMEPEAVARRAGPHARVTCVECHVGAGAEWYVKSKISGLHQVVAVLTNSYSRPIPTPIRNLRPARETCEECHWPEKFFGAQLMQIPHFRYDEANTPEQISLLIRTGGGDPLLGQSSGIHWHMMKENVVEFLARDERMLDIPWVRATRQDGQVVIYQDRDRPLDPSEVASGTPHRMDCIDCHNRPSHVYVPPETAVDRAMSGGRLPRDLPFLKKTAVEALVQPYEDREAARQGIRKALFSFYEERNPDLVASRRQALDETAETLFLIWSRSVFPKMRVDWKTYPSHIGHRNWPGCFRCHDGRHVAEGGETIGNDCVLCHTMPIRSPLTPLAEAMPTGDPEWHPLPLHGRHGDLPCTRCHEAGYRPPLECGDCHRIDRKAPMMAGPCTDCHLDPGNRQPQTPCAECHEDLGGLHREGDHPEAPCTDCHKPHRWAVSGRESCLACHGDLARNHHPGEPCSSCHSFRKEARE